MESVRCYLCDHEFVDGEEPWLMFEQRLREDGQVECSLAVLLGSILQKDLEEVAAHSTLLCDSCNADVLEYESLEKRFSQLRERILNSYKENMTIHDLNSITKILHNENSITSPLDVNSLRFDELISQSTTEMIGTCDADLIEEVPEDDVGDIDAIEDTKISEAIKNKVISESFDFAAFNEHVAQNSLPPGVLNLSDGLVNITVADTDMDVHNVPLEGQDIIIYDVRTKQILEGNMISQQESEESQEMEQYKNDDDADLDFIISSNVFGEENDSKDINDAELLIQSLNETSSASDINLPKPVCKKEGLECICLLCEMSPKYTFESLKHHFQSSHSSKIHMCEYCHHGFRKRQELKIHAESGHTMECDLCQSTFTNHRMFRIHKRMHYSSAKPYECTVCHKKYGSKGMLDEHMNTHTGYRPYKCPECPKDFASKYTLQTHMKIHRERPRPFHCDQCGKQFLNQQNLSQHKKLHVSGKAFECENCHKTFTTQHSLQVHQIVHSGQRPFICRICGKSFARRPEIKDHERTHTGEKPYKCDLCPLAFAQRSNLTSHKKSTHFNEKLHKCEHCLRSFKRKRLLEYHIQAIHTGERPYKCEICGAGFVYPEHFKKHMLIHSGKKPFACEVCGKQFNSRDNRNAHRFVHSDKKPYECMECGAGFMRKPLLLTHMKQTKHTNDTIIVNQPQFTQHISMDDPIGSMGSDTLEDIDNDLQGEGSDECLDKIIFKTDELLAEDPSVSNVEDERDDDVITVESHLIKDELGVVKYLQFEDLERDGNQTLTWVDIGGGDNKL